MEFWLWDALLPISLSSPSMQCPARSPHWHLEVSLTAWGIQAHPVHYVKVIWRKCSPLQEAVLSPWHLQCWFSSADPTLMNFWVVFYLTTLWPTTTCVRSCPGCLSAVLLNSFQSKYKGLGSQPFETGWETALPFYFIYSCLNHDVIALFLLHSIYYASSAACYFSNSVIVYRYFKARQWCLLSSCVSLCPTPSNVRCRFAGFSKNWNIKCPTPRP